MRSRKDMKITTNGYFYWIDNSNIIYLPTSRNFIRFRMVGFLQNLITAKRSDGNKCPNMD